MVPEVVGNREGDCWPLSLVITLRLEPEPLSSLFYSFCTPPPLTPSSHLLSPLVRGREREKSKRDREDIVKLERDGNKKDGYSGPTLTHTNPGLNYTCVSSGSVQMWKESHSSSDPRGKQAGRHQGVLWRGGCIHLGPAHIRCMTDVRRPCTLSHTHTHTDTQAHSALPGSIRHSVMMGGHLSPCAAGGLFGRWSQKSNGIVFMQEIKKPPLCTVMEMRGAGRGEMEGE